MANHCGLRFPTSSVLLLCVVLPGIALGDHEALDVAPGLHAYLSKEAQFAAGIRTVRAERGAVRHALTVMGTAVAPPWARARLAAPQACRVRTITSEEPITVGSRVHAGQVLCRLDALLSVAERAELGAVRTGLKAAVIRGEAELALAEAELTRLRKVQRAISRIELQRAETAVTAARATVDASHGSLSVYDDALAASGEGSPIPLSAPIDGVVWAAMAVPGAVLEAGTVVFEIVDPARLWVEAAVPEGDVREVAPGETCVVERPGGETLDGRVRAVGPAVDSLTRTSVVVVDVEGRAALRLGEASRVFLPTTQFERGIVVPSHAIVRSEASLEVLLLAGSETIRRMPVEVGASDGLRTVVRSGIQEGDRVIVAGISEARAAFRDGDVTVGR